MNIRNVIKKLLITLTVIITIYIQSAQALTSIPPINEKAPSFELYGFSPLNKNKENWSLLDFKNKWLVLYFYPKDFTVGCTLEAKSFQSLSNEFELRNTKIVGISNDNGESHKSFCASEKLSYILLTDFDGKTSSDYGSWNAPFSKRNTFLIDPHGIIKYKWIGVNPIRHANDVLSKLKQIQEE